MNWRKRLLFYTILVAVPVVLVNLVALFVIRAMIGVSPLDPEAYLARKADFTRSEGALSHPHPYIGQTTSGDSATGGTLSGTEPLYAARPASPPPATAIRVLVLGGSLARHLSRNDDRTAVEIDGVSVSGDDILQRVLNEEFRTDRFVVYNAAIGGGKQPQQLFKLQYLLLLGERFDVVLNLDGFNEIALPLAENTPVGTPAILPRAYPHLLSSMFTDVSCIARNNRFAASYSVLPALELAKLAYMYRCTRRTDQAPPSAERAVATAMRSTPRTIEEEVGEITRLWERSSEAIERIARAEGIEYVHVLQPNQYVSGSKRLSPEELRGAYADSSDRYRGPIERYYGRLRFETVDVRHSLDLRQLFRDREETLYRDRCCHLNNAGMYRLSRAIVIEQRSVFLSLVATRR